MIYLGKLSGIKVHSIPTWMMIWGFWMGFPLLNTIKKGVTLQVRSLMKFAQMYVEIMSESRGSPLEKIDVWLIWWLVFGVKNHAWKRTFVMSCFATIETFRSKPWNSKGFLLIDQLNFACLKALCTVAPVVLSTFVRKDVDASQIPCTFFSPIPL